MERRKASKVSMIREVHERLTELHTEAQELRYFIVENEKVLKFWEEQHVKGYLIPRWEDNTGVFISREQAKETLNLWIAREEGSKRRLGQDVEWESKYKDAE
jgi:phosphorylcholine metabolism protein LicD